MDTSPFSFDYTAADEHNTRIHVEIPYETVVSLLATRAMLGERMARQLLLAGLSVSDPPMPPEQAARQVDQFMRAMMNRVRWSAEYQALHVTSLLFRHGEITRAQAAEIAARMLGKPITTEAWRKRMTGWAEHNKTYDMRGVEEGEDGDDHD